MRRRDQILIVIAAVVLIVAAYVNFQDRRLDLAGGEPHQAPLSQPAGQGAAQGTGAAGQPEAAQPETFSWQGYADDTAGFEIKYPVLDPAAASDPEAAPVALPPAAGAKPRTLHIDVLKAADKRLDKDGCADVSDANGQLIGEPTQGSIDSASYCLTTRDVSLVDGRMRSYLYAVKLKSGGRAVLEFGIKFKTPFMVRSEPGCESDADQSSARCRILNFDEKRDADLFGRVLKTFTLTK